MARAAAESGRALVVQSMYPRSPSLVAAAGGRRARLPRDRGRGLGSRAARGPGASSRRAGFPSFRQPVDGLTARRLLRVARELLASAGIEFPSARARWRTSTRRARRRPSSAIRSSSRRSGSCTSRTPAASRSASRTSRLSKMRWQEWQHCLPKGTPSSGWRPSPTASSSSPAAMQRPALRPDRARRPRRRLRGVARGHRGRARTRRRGSRPRSSSARSAARRSSTARAGGRPVDVARGGARRSPRSRASPRRVPDLAEIEINPLLVAPRRSACPRCPRS